MKQDKRKHIFLSNKELIEKLDRIKYIEKITFDEMFEKYLNLPEADDIIQREYVNVEKQMILAYGKKDQGFKNQKLRILMELFWTMIIMSAKGRYDIDQLLHDVLADIDKGTYKKR